MPKDCNSLWAKTKPIEDEEEEEGRGLFIYLFFLPDQMEDLYKIFIKYD